MNDAVHGWVNEVARMCRPDDVVWCDGSESEHERLVEVAVRAGDLIPLDQQRLPAVRGLGKPRKHPLVSSRRGPPSTARDSTSPTTRSPSCWP